MILRIDDIDPARSKPYFINRIKNDLEWLGLDWDEVYFQSERYQLYEDALKDLEKKNLLYKCFCTRKELRLLANAPHPGDMGAPYPGICRNLPDKIIQENVLAGKAWSLRLKCPEKDIVFDDLIQGPQRYSTYGIGGDFALKRSDGIYSYQLASTVDDGLMGVNQVVRGKDLLPSTARQLLLLDALAWQASPAFFHTPLLLDEFGERLAKRHKSLSLASLREKGVSPAEACGFLGRLAGANPYGFAKSANQLLINFSCANLATKNISLQKDLLPDWLK